MSQLIKTISGRGIPVRGNDIDTDRIIPARFLRCVSFDGLGAHAFEDDRRDPNHSFNQSQYKEAAILIANKNFGCGSSREHAPQSLIHWGIQGFIGESFAEIFFGNCITLGVPCMVVDQKTADALQSAVEKNPSLEITLDLVKNEIRAGDFAYPANIPAGPRGQLLDGSWDALGQLLDGAEKIHKIEANLLY